MVAALQNRLLLAALAALAGLSCRPDVPGRSSLVDGDRVLAVQSLPAEAAPGPDGELVTYRALYVGPDGPVDASKIEWAFCTVQKPLAATGPMAEACDARAGKALEQFHSRGAEVRASLPEDACAKFGPSPPNPRPGEPPGRPADPDTTGGYYQPVRVLADPGGEPAYSVAVTRLDCGLAAATADQSREYTKRHLPNENPALDSLELVRSNGKRETLVADGGTKARIAAGESVTFRATWAQCALVPACGDGICTCTGSEPYTTLDPVTHVLTLRREAMRLSWYATDGEYSHERTGRAEDDADSPFTENAWTAPSGAGAVFLWVVLRDDRGGVGFTSYELDVEP